MEGRRIPPPPPPRPVPPRPNGQSQNTSRENPFQTSQSQYQTSQNPYQAQNVQTQPQNIQPNQQAQSDVEKKSKDKLIFALSIVGSIVSFAASIAFIVLMFI